MVLTQPNIFFYEGHHGDPISVYEYMLCLEFLFILVKNDPNITGTDTVWKESKYGVFLVRVFLYSYYIGDLLSKSPYSVQMQENTDQKKLRIWTLFTQ